MTKRLIQQWGFAIFAADWFLSLAFLWKQVAGHYINYTAPASLLWQGLSSYSRNFEGGNGFFFQSPASALYFYSLFTVFPPLLGQCLYMIVCSVVFVTGLLALLKALKDSTGFDLRTSPYRHLIWLMAGSELVGGITAVKVEVLLTGLAMAAVASLLRKRHELAVFALFGFAASWKLQPVVIFGLLLVPLLVHRQWKAPLSLLLGFVFGLVSPVFVLGVEKTWGYSEWWLASLKEYASGAWMDPIFQHIFAFWHRGLGLSVSVETGARVSAAVGLSFAAAMAWMAVRNRKPKNEAQALELLAALGLGSAYIVLFSNLSQSNAYISYFPAALATAVFATRLKWNTHATLSLLIFSFFVVSLAYSDLNPRPLYHWMYGAACKPVGVAALVAAILFAIPSLMRPPTRAKA